MVAVEAIYEFEVVITSSPFLIPATYIPSVKASVPLLTVTTFLEKNFLRFFSNLITSEAFMPTYSPLSKISFIIGSKNFFSSSH